MRQGILVLYLIVFAFCVEAQQQRYSISGKVIDAVSTLPLQSASVFAKNTTIGTVTDADGNFTLSFPAGGYELAITFTGYQSQIVRISSVNTNTTPLAISLNKKEKELSPIVIGSSNEVINGWEKYGVFFLENFIGKTTNSKLCTIKNTDILKFYFFKKSNHLKILAEEPLEIINEALGFKIKYILDSFVYDYNSQSTYYTGYPLLQDMQTIDSIQKSKWIANRKKAYNGSMLHFMRSLYHKKLKEEGFDLRFIITDDYDKEKIVPLSNFYNALGYAEGETSQPVKISPKENEVILLYNKAIPEQSYFTITPQASKRFQLSVLTFIDKEPINIEVNGYYYKQTSIIKSQYLAWKRIADMLPYDFKIN